MKKKLIIIAGPCVIESKDLLFRCAESLKNSTQNSDVEFIFKSSFRKANRTSLSSFEGIGDDIAIKYLDDVKKEFQLKVLTDVHSIEDIHKVGEVVDVIQIPAFLSRQTELIKEAAKTGKTVNIKKAQFMASEDSLKAAVKSSESGASETWITERGTFFGYHDLVVDMRSMIKLSQSDYKVIYDATHSQQQPSIGSQSGGNPEFIEKMAYSAIWTGINGVFFETHPDPKNALSDASTQLDLSKSESFIKNLISIFNFSKEF